MEIEHWSVKVLNNKTEYIQFSLTGYRSVDALLDSFKELELQKVREETSSYTGDKGKVEKFKSFIFHDDEQCIEFSLINGVLKINAGEFCFSFREFDIRSGMKNIESLSIAITYETVNPIMSKTQWELIHLIVIRGIKK